MTTTLAAIAAVLGWAATIVVLGQSGTPLAVPALAGWSITAVLGMDGVRTHQRTPVLVTIALVGAAALFALVAVRAS